MTMESSFWVTVGDIEVGLLALGGMAFLTAYTLLAKWWRTREGKFIFTVSLWLTVLFAYIYASRVGWLAPLDDGSARVWLRLAIFTPFGVGLIWISVLLLLAQRELWIKRKEIVMPLNTDDPARPGNLTDDAYEAAVRRLQDEHGDEGLHIIPGLSDQDDDRG